jgi:hypothetical protein
MALRNLNLDMNNLCKKVLSDLHSYNPKYCIQYNDPRIQTYYISVNRTTYVVLNGLCDKCDRLVLYNNNTIDEDITTNKGLDLYVNNDDLREDDSNIILDLDLGVFVEQLNLNIDDLLLIVKSRL